MLEAHDRSSTDIQMLDRLALNLVSLPSSTYNLILILSDADDTRTESQKLLSRDIIALLAAALKPGGIIKSQDGTFADHAHEVERREAILAGLIVDEAGSAKKPESAAASVSLRLGKSKAEGGPAATTTPIGTGAQTTPSLNGKLANGETNGKHTNGFTNGTVSAAPAGVGFIDFGDDLDAPMDDSDDELIDEDSLLTAEDIAASRVQRKPPSLPKNSSILTHFGSRRRVCPRRQTQAQESVQRLYMWTRTKTRSRRRCPPRQSRYRPQSSLRKRSG